MRLPGFGLAGPSKPGLGGFLQFIKLPIKFPGSGIADKIGDPGNLTSKIGDKISPAPKTPESRKSIAAPPSAVEKQNKRAALLVNK